MRSINIFIVALVLIALTGCGYSTSALLPSDMDSIRVDNFENKIDPAKEVSDRRMSYYYRPGLEIQITRGVIDAFIYDRHLNIESRDNAALLMKGQLVDVSQSPLSYNSNGDIEEYRLEIRVNVELYNNRTGELMWEEKGFMGQSSYDIVGRNRESEAEAQASAVSDLSKSLVERTVENW